jgi:hypothetical protein
MMNLFRVYLQKNPFDRIKSIHQYESFLDDEDTPLLYTWGNKIERETNKSVGVFSSKLKTLIGRCTH